MVKDIEFVCSGNKGRSPLAEAIAKRFIEQKGVKSINVSSSGTLVKAFRVYNEDNVVKFLLPLIPKLLEREIMTSEQAEDIRQRKNIRALQDLLGESIGKLEDYQRRIILEERGLTNYFDFNRTTKQTIVRPEAQIIFPVDQENYERTIQIYSKIEPKPKIESLGEIGDPIFATLSEYRKIADDLEKATLEVMEKYL